MPSPSAGTSPRFLPRLLAPSQTGRYGVAVAAAEDRIDYIPSCSVPCHGAAAGSSAASAGTSSGNARTPSPHLAPPLISKGLCYIPGLPEGNELWIGQSGILPRAVMAPGPVPGAEPRDLLPWVSSAMSLEHSSIGQLDTESAAEQIAPPAVDYAPTDPLLPAAAAAATGIPPGAGVEPPRPAASHVGWVAVPPGGDGGSGGTARGAGGDAAGSSAGLEGATAVRERLALASRRPGLSPAAAAVGKELCAMRACGAVWGLALLEPEGEEHGGGVRVAALLRRCAAQVTSVGREAPGSRRVLLACSATASFAAKGAGRTGQAADARVAACMRRSVSEPGVLLLLRPSPIHLVATLVLSLAGDVPREPRSAQRSDGSAAGSAARPSVLPRHGQGSAAEGGAAAMEVATGHASSGMEGRTGLRIGEAHLLTASPPSCVTPGEAVAEGVCHVPLAGLGHRLTAVRVRPHVQCGVDGMVGERARAPAVSSRCEREQVEEREEKKKRREEEESHHITYPCRARSQGCWWLGRTARWSCRPACCLPWKPWRREGPCDSSA